jgi:hypothetical protein
MLKEVDLADYPNDKLLISVLILRLILTRFESSYC